MRFLLALLLLLAGGSPNLRAQGGDINKMLLDITRADIAKGRQAVAMWMPMDFFVAAGQAQAANLDPAELRKALAILDDFTVMMVNAKSDGEDGQVALSTAQLRTTAVLLDAKAREVKALLDLPPKLDLMLAGMRQAMSAQAGGADFRILVFPAKDADGKPLANPTQRGTLLLRINKVETYPGSEFTWRTPLASFVSPMNCTKCQESIQPAWSFCPWCGTTVQAKGK